jgi:formylglycine-generating enzyme required for sulfatase activity
MSTKSSSSPAAAQGAGTGQPVPARRAARNRAQHQLRNMAWIPGGTFAMGSAGFYPEERPVHRASVDGFWMDTRPVPLRDPSTGNRC